MSTPLEYYVIDYGALEVYTTSKYAELVRERMGLSDRLSIEDIFGEEITINPRDIKAIYKRSPSMLAAYHEWQHDVEQTRKNIWSPPFNTDD